MIKIGFSANNSICSRIIRWFTKGKVSHAYIVFYDSCLNSKVVFEALWYGFCITPYKKLLKRTKVISEFKCKEDLSSGIHFLTEKLGQDYDYKSVIGIVLKKWFKKLLMFRNPNKFHCSEIVTLFLQYNKLAENFDPETTSPEDLYQYCYNSNKFEE